MEFSATFVAELGETKSTYHVITALCSLYVDLAFGTKLSVLLTIMQLFGPIFEHFVAFFELVATDAIMPWSMTIKAPYELTFNALYFGRIRKAGRALDLAE